jgi:CRP-like cAMP-binding protein
MKSSPGKKEDIAELLVIGSGEMFGDVEAHLKCPRLTSCVATNNSTLIAISRSDFFRRINNKRSWNQFNSTVSSKEALLR